MTWEAKFLPSQRAEGWVASSDVTLVPPLAALTPDEQAAFIQARDAWITAARTFIAHKAGAVSGRIVGYRHERSAFGRPDAQIIMEFGLWRLSNVVKVAHSIKVACGSLFDTIEALRAAERLAPRDAQLLIHQPTGVAGFTIEVAWTTDETPIYRD